MEGSWKFLFVSDWAFYGMQRLRGRKSAVGRGIREFDEEVSDEGK